MPSVTLNLSEQLSKEVKPYSQWLPAILELGLLAFRTPAHEAVQEFIRFLKSNPSAQAVYERQLPENVQERLNYLLTTNQEHVLSAAETHELDDYMKLEHVVRMIKANLNIAEFS